MRGCEWVWCGWRGGREETHEFDLDSGEGGGASAVMLNHLWVGVNGTC